MHFVFLMLITFTTHAQIFWSETFGSGCNSGTIANGYTTSNGEWQVDALPMNNGANANIWYISAEENGEGIGNCGAGCGNKPTLHIGNNSIDDGAKYSTASTANTEARAISPIINASNYCSISLTFEYLEFGDGTNDNLTVWYFDGSTWSLLEDPPKTTIGSCSPNGLWESRTVNLPASADNNPNVQIGFQWENNGDGVGTNPSSAIYNIQLSSGDVTAPIIACPSDQTVNNGTDCAYQITDFSSLITYSDDCGTATLTQTPAINTEIGVGTHVVEYTAEDASGNTSTCSFNLEVIETLPPTITCPSNISSCDSIVNYDDPIVVENCTDYTITQIDGTGYSSGIAFPVGTTIQQYQVTDGSGNVASCTFEVEVLVSPDSAIIISNDEEFCETSSATIEAQPISSGTGEWNVISGNGVLDNALSPLTDVNNLSYGVNTFVWTVSTPSCGLTSDTVNIFVYETPSQANTQSKLTLCNDTLINIVATNPIVGSGSWSDIDSSALFTNSTSPNTVLYNLQEGINEIVWTVSNGVCESNSDTVLVFNKTIARIYTPDTSVCILSDDFEIQGSPVVDDVSAIWYVISGTVDFENIGSSSPTITYIDAGENQIVYGQNHPVCGTTTDTITITGEQCETYNPIIPTVMTPNNDGKNDLFIIQNLNAVFPNSEVVIVNRWGNVVYESTGYESPWNGTYMNEGKELDAGTYFYRIVLNDAERNELSGSISIIR
ncbi:hypothetical protein CW751_11855 [Brumimicrobium salinarum]|uniref:HYR domain-containing protein n=1 Tax=Brumimicrobium salinarum TaxID=2058658 RepID=A0A2I0R0F1_9FLAO|nr:gliding motility-associated C-terminal domain-containing protein [Brumimicrobium salinarum]PKR80054.1 hypothetical protein CW751_11855 [Brumimicrobium salinarum]